MKVCNLYLTVLGLDFRIFNINKFQLNCVLHNWNQSYLILFQIMNLDVMLFRK